MKNNILLSICLYFVACGGSSDKNAAELWDNGKTYRTEDKLKESIISYKTILDKYPSDNFAPKAQFQIADKYLNDVKDFNFAIEEFQKVVAQYPDHEVAKKSLFMIAYIYNNYLDAYSDAIATYNLFREQYPKDELIPSVDYELDGLKNIQSTIDSLNSIVSKKPNILICQIMIFLK